MKTDRRQLERRPTALPVRIRVLAEEETFTPFQYRGHLSDMSAAGAMITIPNVTVEEYAVVFRRPRFLRLQCRFPSAGKPSVFFGRVVWHEFCPDRNPEVCRVAVAFEPLKDSDLRRLVQFLETAAESD